MLTGSRGDIVKIGDFGLAKSIQEYASISQFYNKIYFYLSIFLANINFLTYVKHTALFKLSANLIFAQLSI